MKRYTKKNENEHFISIDEIVLTGDKFTGDAINQFAAFEDFYQDLLCEKDRISEQLDFLRQANKTKTVTFRQLFANKISIEIIIERVHRYQKK